MAHHSQRSYLGTLFQEEELNRLAHQSGFTSRRSAKLSGFHFFDLQVNYLSNASPQEQSLEDMCHYLGEKYGISYTKGSLDAKYTPRAVAFLRSCFEALMSRYMEEVVGGLPFQTPFQGIKISDSVSFQLPSGLQDLYPGSKGRNHMEAGLKIFYSYDLLHPGQQHFQITHSTASDVHMWQGYPCQASCLYIQDLGFFSLKQYSHMARQGAYFLSRYKTGVKVYIKNQEEALEEIDLATLLASAPERLYQKEVYLGKEEALPVRLLALAVPEALKKQRIEKLKKQYQTHRRGPDQKAPELSTQKQLLCGYNLFITNACEQDLPTHTMAPMYTLRWQIELLFKIWKSLFQIDKLGPMDIDRFHCYLYGRLIALMVCTSLGALIKDALAQHSPPSDMEELSEWKVMKMIKKNSSNCLT